MSAASDALFTLGYQPSQFKRLTASGPVGYTRPGMVNLGAISNTFWVWSR